MFSAEQALGFQPRATLVDHVRATTGLDLCGAGTECAEMTAPASREHRTVPGRPRAARAAGRRRRRRAVAALACWRPGMLVVRDGNVAGWERDTFDAVNGLPDWLYPVLWPFQQLGVLRGRPGGRPRRRARPRATGWPWPLVAATVAKLVLERVVKAIGHPRAARAPRSATRSSCGAT